MDLLEVKELVLLQQSSTARLDLLESQILELSKDIKEIKDVHKKVPMDKEGSVERLLETFHKSQGLTLELIAEFRHLKRAVVSAALVTIAATIMITVSAAYWITRMNSAEVAKTLTSIIDNQTSMEDVILSNTAMHTKTQDLLRHYLEPKK